MWAGRSNTLLRVAVVSFLFAAATARAASAQPGQKPEQTQAEEERAGLAQSRRRSWKFGPRHLSDESVKRAAR